MLMNLNSPYTMSFTLLHFLGFMSLMGGLQAETLHERGLGCLETQRKPTPIGIVIDYDSRIGKEQKVAIKMASLDHLTLCKSAKMESFFYNSKGNSTNGISGAISLIDKEHVKVIFGTMKRIEVDIIFSDVNNKTGDDVLFVSLASWAMNSPSVSFQSFPLLHMANDVVYHVKCISAIVGRYQWPKITVLVQKRGDVRSSDTELMNLISDSLRKVNSEVEHVAVLSLFTSLSDTEAAIEEELQKFKKNSNRVFIVTQFSLELGILLLQRARKMNMTGKDYVWIVMDEMAILLDSVESSNLNDMEGVIGVRTFVSGEKSRESVNYFNTKFRQIYRSEYPQEEGFSDPSVFALRCYDAFQVISQAFDKVPENITSKELLQNILQNRFQGLTGKIRFNKNGVLSSMPTFQIINIVGERYKEIAFWSPRFGFSETIMEEKTFGERRIKGSNGFLQSINLERISKAKARSLSEEDKLPLKFAIPADAACKTLINISHDSKNKTQFSGYTIEVFTKVVESLPFQLHYEFVPFHGTYDEMVKAVSTETLYFGAVGDISVFADRLEYVDFSHPYMNSNVMMVVQNGPMKWKKLWDLLEPFTWRMWLGLLFMHLVVCTTVSLIERGDNVELKSLGDILWFSVAVIFFAHREPIRKNMARLVLAPWLFSILIMTACFTATLTSKMTISRMNPSILTIEEARTSNVRIGCNKNSFLVNYLTDVLRFEADKIEKMDLIEDYPQAFKSGKIAAAFLMAPHAKFLLAKYCDDYAVAASFGLGGVAFAFKKGSSLNRHISKAILRLLETRNLPLLETTLHSLFNCSSPATLGDIQLGLRPFAGLFIITGGFSVFALLYIISRLVGMRLGLIDNPSKQKLKSSVLRRKLSSVKVLSRKYFRGSRSVDLSFCPQSPNGEKDGFK